ncbi:MAG: hypothetical protein JEZ12_23270 [Desulfobacterium sp.]|nr:hypothetical protein [Desulfobacterium sp.]
MEVLSQMTAGGMAIIRGRIINMGKDGTLTVKPDAGGVTILCDFLRTSAGPLPRLYLGTPVLCVAAGTRGYVLGVIQPYLPQSEEKEDPPELTLKAKDSIELTCGESVLSMDKNGKIVLRGENITTRASGQNKIKGAGVQIN